MNGTGSFTVKVDRTIPLNISGTGSVADLCEPASVGQMFMDRGAVDRGSFIGTCLITPSVKVNRTIPLSIDATGEFIDPLTNRTIPLGIAGTGSLSLLLNRTLELSLIGQGGFDDPVIKRLVDIAFGATGSPEVDPFLRGLFTSWGATGGYLYLTGEKTFTSALFFDRGRYDLASLVSTAGMIPPILVSRTIPLSIAGTGLFTDPIFDWYLQCVWGATGHEIDPLINRTIPLVFDGTGHFDDIIPFIPVHHLTAGWSATGTFISGFTWTYDLYWGARGKLVQTNPYIPIHYLSASWGATGSVIDPRVWRAIININNLLISGKISRSLADKMYSAVFQFDKTTTSDSLYWSKVIFKMPDYTGTTFNTVFVGVIPSGDTQYTNKRMFATATGKQQFKAYDYAWYLSNQPVEPENQVFLTWADQQASYNHTYQLAYKDGTILFTPGDRIRGNYASTDSATVISVVGTVSSGYLILSSMIGSSPYFQDGEPLAVNFVDYAKADGSAVDLTPSPTRMYPGDYIYKLLGGDTSASKWAEVTGIYPLNFKSTASVWGSTIPEIEFAFTQTTTKMQAIEKICNYMNWIFYVRWGTPSGGSPDTPCACFIPREDLDVTPDQPLPVPVYVTSTTDYNAADARKHLKSSFKLVQSGENQYNWYTVRCQGLSGEWHEAYDYDGNPYDPTFNPTGTEIKRPYTENNPNITTYAECVVRVADLKAYYSSRVQTWTATFRLRSDFALLQKLIISGYETSLPDGDYRIINIDYNYDKAGTVNEVTVQIIPDAKFDAFLNLKRVFYDPIFEIQNIAQKIYDDSTTNLKGTVIVGNTLPSQVIKVAVTGVYGAVTRTAYSTVSLAVNDSVTLTQDQTSGRLMAVKA